MTDDTIPLDAASLRRALAEVDWAGLEDAYGPAVDVPEQLLDLAEGGAHWEAALEALYAGVFHQGGCFSATPVAVRFLIGMLTGDTRAPKAAILKFLAELSMGHADDVAIGFDPWVFRSQPPSADYPEGEATLRAVGVGAAAYVELLCHTEAEVRAAAAYVCAGVEPARVRAAPVALSRLFVEPHPEVLASLALCLGRAGDARELSPLLTHSEPVVRGAAAVGWIWGGEAATEPVLSALVDGALSNQCFTVLPWSDEGSLSTLAVAALSRARAEGRLWEVLRTRLARGERPIDQRFVGDLACRSPRARWRAPRCEP